MKQLLRRLASAICLAAAVSLMAQTPPAPATTQEKLYISLENTDNLAVVDLKTFKHAKTLKVGMHPHGQASPARRTSCMSPPKSAAPSRSSTQFATRSSRHSTWALAIEPQNGAITPDGRFLYQPSYAGYWQVFDTQKEQIIEYIHTLGIGHNTVMAPDGRFAYLLPIVGGPGHFARAVSRAAENAAEGSDGRRCAERTKSLARFQWDRARGPARSARTAGGCI